MIETLTLLRKQLEEVCSQWNGDDTGVAEIRANEAEEGIKNIDELLNVLEQLKINS